MNQSQITKTLVVLTLLSGATILIGCGANPDILIPPTAQNAPTSGSPGKTDPSPDFTPHVSADTTTPKSSCVSMNQAIGFEAIPTPPGQLGSPTIDFMTIRFGQIISETPGVPHRSFGQVTMTPVGVGGPYQAPNKQLTTIIDGNVSMDITILPADQIPGYTPKMGPIGTLAKMTGVINLSKSKKDRILAKVAAQFPQMIAPGSGP